MRFKKQPLRDPDKRAHRYPGWSSARQLRPRPSITAHRGAPMATEPVFEAINWNKIQDDKDLEVWDR
ncbi:hypothetical protein, partial [Actinomyces sp.]